MSDVVLNVSSVMRGAGEGRVLVRDYAAGDLAQARFAVKEGQRLGDNFYVRGDGTRAYYFTPAALKGIFRRVLLAPVPIRPRRRGERRSLRTFPGVD